MFFLELSGGMLKKSVVGALLSGSIWTGISQKATNQKFPVFIMIPLSILAIGITLPRPHFDSTRW